MSWTSEGHYVLCVVVNIRSWVSGYQPVVREAHSRGARRWQISELLNQWVMIWLCATAIFMPQNRTPLECEHIPSNLTNFPFSLRINFYVKYFNGVTAPSGPGPPRYSRGLTIKLRHTTLGGAPFGRMINQTQRPLPANMQHSLEKDFYSSDRIRTRNPSKRAAADPITRPRGHRDRLSR